MGQFCITIRDAVGNMDLIFFIGGVVLKRQAIIRGHL
jgi:hypothetical protein